MNQVTILHNPGCSKSRAALELLVERGIAPAIIDYLREPPGIEELEQLLALLGMEPRDLMRRGDDAYQANGLDNPSLARGELVAALHANPGLIQRPIVLANGKAAMGRPPEAILDIL